MSTEATSLAGVKALAAEKWFGYGRWDAPYWFIGMEPGGDDEHSSYESWLELDPDGVGLIDCYAHHMDTKHTAWHRWHGMDVPPIQPTWGPLIRAMLAFLDRPNSDVDVSRFQRNDWGRVSGETAVIELSALHARSLSVDVERTLFRDERILRIKAEMDVNQPRFALFYGTSYRNEYERVAGFFGPRGCVWSGSTLCVLVTHPAYRFAPRGEYWNELGQWLRVAVDRGPQAELQPMPAATYRRPATRVAEKRTSTRVTVTGCDEFSIRRNGNIVGRVLYDGWNLRVEKMNDPGGYTLLGYYERAQPTTVARKIVEIDDVFDSWCNMESTDPERIHVSWRKATFVPNFSPPSGAIDIGCSVVEDDGVEVARIYKVRPNRALWLNS